MAPSTRVAGSATPAAVLFDMDGTLIESEELWWRAECEVVDGLGGTWSREDQAHCLGGPLERVSEHMVRITGSTVPPAEIGRRLLETMESLLRSHEVPYRPGAVTLLRECQARGCPTALVSASHRPLLLAAADAIARGLGMDADRVFDVTVAGDEVSDSKPHPEPYLTAARRLQVPIEECVVIEDSPTGVASGQASGAFVVAVPDLVPIPPAARRVVVSTLEGVTLDDLGRWLADAARNPDSLRP